MSKKNGKPSAAGKTEHVSYCPFGVDGIDWRRINVPAAEAACLSLIPEGAEILALDLPDFAEEAFTLKSGVRVVVAFVPFPTDGGLPGLRGMCHVRWQA